MLALVGPPPSPRTPALGSPCLDLVRTVRMGLALPPSPPLATPPCCLTRRPPSRVACSPPARISSCLAPPLYRITPPPSRHRLSPFSVSIPPSSSLFPHLLVVVSPVVVITSGCRFVLVAGLDEGYRKWIAKTSHDKCRGSCFATHHWGIQLHGSLSPSSLPGSSVERD